MKLQPYERHMACLISGLLIGLSLVVFCDHRSLCETSGDDISIHVVGAVEEAHVCVRAGTTLEDLLQTVHVHPDADISELDGIRRLTDGEVIVVPHEGLITVYVTGAVEEPKVVTISMDGRPNDILQFVKFRDDADRKSFLRRKRVKNGEIIKIKTKRNSRSG